MTDSEIILHNSKITESYVSDFRNKFQYSADNIKKAIHILLENGENEAKQFFSQNEFITYKKSDKINSFGILKKPLNSSNSTKRNLKGKDKFTVFRNHNYHCQYTGIKLINHPLIELLSYIFPDEFPYCNPPHGGNEGEKNTHLLVWVLWPSIDHILPLNYGGKNDIDNYTTSNSKFNGFKSDCPKKYLGYKYENNLIDRNWDGLEKEYLILLNKFKDKVPMKKLKIFNNWNKEMGFGVKI